MIKPTWLRKTIGIFILLFCLGVFGLVIQYNLPFTSVTIIGFLSLIVGITMSVFGILFDQ